MIAGEVTSLHYARTKNMRLQKKLAQGFLVRPRPSNKDFLFLSMAIH